MKAMKIAAAIVIYCLLLRLTWHLGIIGIIAALISGSCATAMIILARRQDVIPLVRLFTSMMLGALVSTLFPCVGSNVNGDVCGIQYLIFGTLLGALVGMFINLLNRPVTPLPRSDTSEPNRDTA